MKVKSGINYKSFKTFKGSVFNSKEAKEKCDLINGKILKSYQFDGEKLAFFFDEGLVLVISCGNDKVDWEITKNIPIVNSSPKNNLEFELPSGTRFEWGWKEILDSFLMKEVFVAPSHQLFFMSTRGSEEYMFDIFCNADDSNKRYLHIS